MLELKVARFTWQKTEPTASNVKRISKKNPEIPSDMKAYDAVMYWCGGCEDWREVGKGATFSHGCRLCGESFPLHGPTPRDAPRCGGKLIFKG